MPIVVQKYGGSSVADVAKIERVADRVVALKAQGVDLVVVVSAMGKTTDELLKLANQISESPPRRELDMLLTTGERISMALLSMAIHKRGFDAISFTGSQSGIITNDRHFDARIIEIRPTRIEDELARGRIVIVAGYQGMSYRREITTLGRGGSDTTAVAMAAALGAERAEIYSDVDGVYSADPRVVRDAEHLPEIGYDQMTEMAAAGAKVLNAQAVEFARHAKITIHARATSGSDRETVVRPSANARLGIVGQKQVCRLSGQTDRSRELALRLLDEASVPYRDFAQNGDGWRLLCSTGLTPDWSGLKKMLTGINIEEGFGTVSVIGNDWSRVLPAVPKDVVSVEGTGLRLTILLAEDCVDSVTSTLHQASQI